MVSDIIPHSSSLPLPSLPATLTADESHESQLPLNRALSQLIEDYSMVSFLPLDPQDEDSIEQIVLAIDMATQYGEDMEPRELKDNEADSEGVNVE